MTFTKHPVKKLERTWKNEMPLNLWGFRKKFNTLEDLYSETFNNEAVLHKSCSLHYNNKKLNQKHKSYDKLSQNQGANIDGDTLEIPKK